MTFKVFSEINRVRCESPLGFNHALTSWSTSDWITAVIGELGEAANIAKKLNRYRGGTAGEVPKGIGRRIRLSRPIVPTPRFQHR